ncbi:MAG: outer membrane protein assembly factor BamD [Myxococcota bacterium]|nr:outer membrane protein assembly factor BamD [Myxococcota bacterium]
MKRTMCLVVFCFFGCSDTNRDRSYLGNARYAFQLGMEELQDGNYLDAIQHFSEVRNKYPYSQYAALADVRLADTYFEQEKYVDAISEYRTFMQRRPNHREVPHALRRIGDSYYEQRPSNFFLLPPAYEMDRGATHDAVRSYQTFLQRFKDDPSVPAVKERLTVCRRALASFEMYVANFYLRQDRPRSARSRLERIYQDFTDVPSLWRDGAEKLVGVYLTLARDPSDDAPPFSGGEARAKAVLDALAKRFPKSSETKAARARLVGGE